MSSTKSVLVSIIIAIEALILLLPSTMFFLGGMLFSIFSFFGANDGGVTPFFLVIAALLLLPGYGLYSLWWLVLKHRKIYPSAVPRFIWGGVAVGVLVALLFISPILFSGFAPPTPTISRTNSFTVMLAIGGGPLLVALTLLFIMWPWRKNQL